MERGSVSRSRIGISTRIRLSPWFCLTEMLRVANPRSNEIH